MLPQALPWGNLWNVGPYVACILLLLLHGVRMLLGVLADLSGFVCMAMVSWLIAVSNGLNRSDFVLDRGMQRESTWRILPGTLNA
jgi:hypothetical protein